MYFFSGVYSFSYKQSFIFDEYICLQNLYSQQTSFSYEKLSEFNFVDFNYLESDKEIKTLIDLLYSFIHELNITIKGVLLAFN